MNIDIRPADAIELDTLVEVVAHAIEESQLNVELDYQAARDFLWLYMNDNETSVLVADQDGDIVGAVMLAEAKEFFIKPLCYVCKFWVLPKGRRTTAARQLLQAVKEWASERQCSHIFVTATADLDAREQRLFINLMKRSGFSADGPVLRLKME